MAVATAFVPTTMPDLSLWVGITTSATATLIIISDGTRHATYTGSCINTDASIFF